MWEKNKNRSSKEWNGCISGVNLLCCSLIISRSKGRDSYIKITFQGFPVEIDERMKEKSLFEERRNMVSFSSGNCGRLKCASVLP